MLINKKRLPGLLLVIAIEEYGLTHHIPSAAVFEFFKEHQLFPMLLTQCEILRILSDEQSAHFEKDPLARIIYKTQERLPLSHKYMLEKTDLTLDIYEKIHGVAELIAKEKQISFEEALGEFMKSHAYWCLQTPATAMWGESDEFILDEFMAEKKSS